MATYKGIAFPDRVAPLVRHMPAVEYRREALAALGGTWDTLALLAPLSGFKTDMREVRASFGELTSELLACLAQETLALAEAALGHRAQIALDLLARALSERRAGIGLLATDDAIVRACVANAGFATLHERLRRHAAAHAAIGDIVLLAPDGQVLTRLAAGFAGRSTSPILERALQGQSGPVESCESTDFCNGERALTLACRIEHEGRAVGVLGVAFDLERVAAAIFERLAPRDDVLAVVDGQGRVAISSDAASLPPGRGLGMRDGAPTVRLGGVTHLAARRAGRPQEGRPGPGWSVMALVPLELAFGEDRTDALPADFSGETGFSPRLDALSERAREIQRRLDRLVWNGRLQPATESDAFTRSLLEEIAAAVRKTSAHFEHAASELPATVVSTLLGEARLLADLSTDLLHRKLRDRTRNGLWLGAEVALAVDAAPQFEALLRAALPEAPGAVAAWCRRDGAAIGRTGELPVTLPASVLSLAAGNSWAGTLAEGDDRFAVVAAGGGGLGQSERGDDETVIAIVVVPCGRGVDPRVPSVPKIVDVAGGAAIATFLIGGHLLGVPARDVVECIEVGAAMRVWRGGFAQRHVGFVTWNDMALPLVDIGADVNAAGAAQRHALVLQAGPRRFGLLVSDLGPVADMQLTEARSPDARHAATRLFTQLARSGAVFIPVLSPDAIFGGAAG